MITVHMMCFVEKWDRDNEHGKTNTQGIIFFEDKVKIKKKEIENKTFDNVRRSFNQMNIRDEEKFC
jgi:hypothetical protein